MKFYSDLTKKLYDSAEACKKAEDEQKKALEEQQTKAKVEQEEKKAMAQEITKAFEEMRTAQKKYDELRSEFIKRWGYYHVSYSDASMKTPFSIFEDFFTF